MMKMNMKWMLSLVAALVFVACDTDVEHKIAEVEAPAFVSSVPADNATDVRYGTVPVTLKYDKNIFFATDDLSKITLTGDGSIVSADVYGSSTDLVIYTQLKRGKTYTINVPEGVVLGPNKMPAPAVTVQFSTAALTAGLANTSATATTQKVFNYLVETYGEKVISGAMANVNWNTEEADRVYTLTGKYPAINTFDYVHLPFSSPSSWIDYSDITPAKDWWTAGGLVSIMWHWNVPTSGGELVSTQIWPAGVAMPGDWSGSLQLTAGGGVDPAALFANVAVGDAIKVHARDVQTGAQGSVKNSDWGQIAEGYEYFDITGDYTISVTADILTTLQSGGMIISGHDYTLTKVTLESGDTSTALWEEKPFEVGSWGALQVTNTELFADVTVGSKIRIATADIASDAQGSIKNSDWAQIAEGYEYFNISGDYEMEVTEDILTSLQSGGMIISGQNYTVTGIFIETGGLSSEYAFYKDQTAFDAANATVAGTWENDVFTADLEKVATLLKQLQEAGISVIWRPFHEAAGGWFWWGKDAESSKTLWVTMFDYFKAEGVNNLIWVWTSQSDDEEWYPGDNYVDMIGRDLYGESAADAGKEYMATDNVYSSKPIGLSECGGVGLLSEQWAAGARWSWFMPWYGGPEDGEPHGTDAWWEDAMSQDFVITRDQLPAF